MSVRIKALAARLAAAADAYHNGHEPLMTDDEYDDGMDELRELAPEHPFLQQVGADTANAVDLPIPLPSLSKLKPEDGTLPVWVQRNPAPFYVATPKLDGVSALWFPETRKLYTRGNGMQGRDISAFVPHFTGFGGAAIAVRGELASTGRASPSNGIAIRGELIMRTDSLPADKLARGIVAGILNRKPSEFDAALYANVRFVAYELVVPVDRTPLDALDFMRAAGLEVVTHARVTDMSTSTLSALFSATESASPYQLDGLVLAPNVARPATWKPTVRKGNAINPPDRMAWKTRLVGVSATTLVRAVEWNVSSGGYLIPRVLFDPVKLSGATISAATGLHGRWIYENRVGPGAQIEIRRAGDVIPQIVRVITPAASPSMPATAWEWDGAVHIRPKAGTLDKEQACIQLTKALRELGAENVGPGIVEKLYAAGFKTIRQIYGATVADLAGAEGFQQRGAERTYEGLRAGQKGWTELTFMVASCTMPRGVGHTKLMPLLEVEPNVARWPEMDFGAIAGISAGTLDSIRDAVPAYLAWRDATGLSVPTAKPAAKPPATRFVVVFTGERDKALEASLEAAGHTVGASITKATTHVVYPDGPEPTSSKITKAHSQKIPVMTRSEFTKLMS